MKPNAMIKSLKPSAAALLAACTLAAGCAVEQLQESQQQLTFRASYLTTKTSLSGFDVYFESSDQISLFSASDNTNSPLSTSISDRSKSADFTGGNDGEDTEYFLMYPYTAGASMAGSVISGLSIPSEQTGTAGTFSPGAALSYGYSRKNDGTLTKVSMTNLCSVLKFGAGELSDAAIASVRLTVPEDSHLTGASSVSVDTEDSSKAALSCSGGNTVTMTVSETGTYYICVAPGTYQSLQFVYMDANGDPLKTRTLSSAITFAPGKIYSLGNYGDMSRVVEIMSETSVNVDDSRM